MPSSGRPSGRPLFLTVENPTVSGRPAGRPTVGLPTELAPTSIFFRPISWGCFVLLSTRFLESFQASFSYLSKYLSPLVLGLIFPYQKESFQECFVKEIS